MRVGVLRGSAIVVAVGVTLLGALSEWRLRSRHEAPTEDLPVLADSASVAEGRRLAILLGCWEGCHGRAGEGLVFSEPGLGRVVAANLTRRVPEYSDAELVRLLRFGIRRDGTSAVGMPSYTFYPLAREDLARLIAQLRAVPEVADSLPPRGWSLATRARIALGLAPLSVAQVDRSRPRYGEEPRLHAFERGRYLASIICAECHGVALEGLEVEGSPSLEVARGYDREQFGTLMRTGRPIDGRDLGIMSETARAAFVLFTDHELDDLHTFLRERPPGVR